jgi:hypothetical protein
MSHAADTRSLGLSPDVARKVAIARAHLAKRDRIARIRLVLQGLTERGEREWERRRMASVGGGENVPQLLLDAIAIETDFEALLKELDQ